MSADHNRSINGQATIHPETMKAALELWMQTGDVHNIPVIGISMLPLLRDGDQVLVAHDRSEIRVGEIVVFQRAADLVAHRVLRVYFSEGSRTLLTKGDNALSFDSLHNEQELVGRVIGLQRGDQRMSLDTSSWRRINKLVALGMLIQGELYSKLVDQKGTRSRLGYAKVATVASRLIVGGYKLLLVACLAVFGRWQS